MKVVALKGGCWVNKHSALQISLQMKQNEGNRRNTEIIRSYQDIVCSGSISENNIMIDHLYKAYTGVLFLCGILRCTEF